MTRFAKAKPMCPQEFFTPRRKDAKRTGTSNDRSSGSNLSALAALRETIGASIRVDPHCYTAKSCFSAKIYEVKPLMDTNAHEGGELWLCREEATRKQRILLPVKNR